MRSTLIAYLIISIVCLQTIDAGAQVKKDSVEKKSTTKKALKKGINLISTTPKDNVKNDKSVNPYLAYNGKIIRSIRTEHIGFEKSIYDSTKKVKKIVAD